MRSTWPPSPKSATTHPDASTTSANKTKARPAKKRCGHSSDTSATPSTNDSSPTPAVKQPSSTNSPVGSGGQREDDTESSVAGITPHTTRLFGTVTPEPDNTLTTRDRRDHRP